MSSTGRGGRRRDRDLYETPRWCVERLLEFEPLALGRRWLDPCTGSGQIVDAVLSFHGDEAPSVTAYDVAPPAFRGQGGPHDDFDLLGRLDRFAIVDYLSMPPAPQPFDVAIANPPYSRALPFILRMLQDAKVVACLLPLSFLASEARQRFMRLMAPDVYVLPNRPSFTGQSSDSNDYAWMVWRNAEPHRSIGRMQVLGLTPHPVRLAEGRRLRARSAIIDGAALAR